MQTTTTTPDPAPPVIEEIAIGDIQTDGGTQTRVTIDQNYVDELAEAIEAEAKLPPAIVFFDGTHYRLVDGFHRVAAYRKLGYGHVECEVHRGTQAEARWFSYSANREHDTNGLRRTNADKKRAVQAALAHPMAVQMTDGAIAAHVGVSQNMVSEYRRALKSDLSQAAPPTATRPLASDASHPAQTPPAAPDDDLDDDEADENNLDDEEDDGGDEPEEPEPAPRLRKGRDGRVINTFKIGKKAKARKPDKTPTSAAAVAVQMKDGLRQIRAILDSFEDLEPATDRRWEILDLYREIIMRAGMQQIRLEGKAADVPTQTAAEPAMAGAGEVEGGRP